MNHSVSVTVTPWVGWRWFVNSWYCDKAFLWCLRRTFSYLRYCHVGLSRSLEIQEIMLVAKESMPGRAPSGTAILYAHVHFHLLKHKFNPSISQLSAAQHGWSLEGASPLLPSFLLCAPSMARAFTGSGPVTPAAGAPPHRPS